MTRSQSSMFSAQGGVGGLLVCILFLIVGDLSGVWAAEPPRELGWQDLQVKVEFEDPFEALTADQLMKLSIYARVIGMQERAPEKVSEGMTKEAADAAEWLKQEGVDIEGLLVRREEIKQLRIKRANAMDQGLHGTSIRMPGYALALEYEDKRVKEFLLVPWVGACIHTPPPPPNQIVYVEAAEAFQVASRFEPVWIEGTMEVGAAKKQLFLVDGTADIDIGYSLTDAVVEPYRTGPKAVVRQAQH